MPPHHRFAVLAAGAVVMAALSCKAEPAAPVVVPEEANPYDPAPPMRAHFDRGNALREAIARGELDQAKHHAKWFRTWVVGNQVPLRWRSHVPFVHAAADRIAGAEELHAAAVGAADMALACGGCHRAQDVEISFEGGRPPAEGDATWPHMDRHAWAVERLWQGLVGPSEEAWHSGAEALLEAPLHDADEMPEGVAALANRVHGLGASASTTQDQEGRAGHLGELLATCAHCHALVRDSTQAAALPGGRTAWNR